MQNSQGSDWESQEACWLREEERWLREEARSAAERKDLLEQTASYIEQLKALRLEITQLESQINKELKMLKEMNENNAKQAKDYKDKYYRASKEVKRLTEEASKWYDFQEEIRKLEVERESKVNKLQNDLATTLKKQATYEKRKDCSKEDVQANEKTIELTGKMIIEAKQVRARELGMEMQRCGYELQEAENEVEVPGMDTEELEMEL
ncbi:hypothetical protein L7F22_002860 [Adiantum nelumboides]|nr:hypothetical protein [Adiantum nelumboides]